MMRYVIQFEPSLLPVSIQWLSVRCKRKRKESKAKKQKQKKRKNDVDAETCVQWSLA
jgi:hypothetical protein